MCSKKVASSLLLSLVFFTGAVMPFAPVIGAREVAYARDVDIDSEQDDEDARLDSIRTAKEKQAERLTNIDNKRPVPFTPEPVPPPPPVNCAADGVVATAKKWWDIAFGNGPFAAVGCALLGVASWVIWLESVAIDLIVKVLDYVVELSVRDFGKLIPDGGGVLVAWKASRDLANLFFIFLLLYYAIGHMLELPSVNLRSVVIRILTVAVFINFSWALTRIVIDSTNVVADEIFSQMTGGRGSEKTSLGTYVLDSLNPYKLISKQFPLNALSGGSVTKQTEEILTKNANSAGLTDAVIQSVGSITVAFAIGFVLLAAVGFLLARIVALLMALALAPIAFLTTLFPKFDFMKEWWESLFNNAIFAPAFFFMLYVALQAISGANKHLAIGSEATLVSQTIGYMIFIALIGASLEVARRLSIVGADAAMGMYKSSVKAVGAWTANKATLGFGPRALSLAGQAVEKAQGMGFNRERYGLVGGALAEIAGQVSRGVPGLNKLPALGRNLATEQGKDLAQYTNDALKAEHGAIGTSTTRRAAIVHELAKRKDLVVDPSKHSGFTAAGIQSSLDELERSGITREDKLGSFAKLGYQWTEEEDPAKLAEIYGKMDPSDVGKISDERMERHSAAIQKGFGSSHIAKLNDDPKKAKAFGDALVARYYSEKGNIPARGADESTETYLARAKRDVAADNMKIEEFQKWARDELKNSSLARYYDAPAGKAQLENEHGFTPKPKKPKNPGGGTGGAGGGRSTRGGSSPIPPGTMPGSISGNTLNI
ncbi:MAG: hypothetical protein Q8Q18_02215 [bacterium]|nr:hypothetical protein [bacterium]